VTGEQLCAALADLVFPQGSLLLHLTIRPLLLLFELQCELLGGSFHSLLLQLPELVREVVVDWFAPHGLMLLHDLGNGRVDGR
jgi:hypothetical protein